MNAQHGHAFTTGRQPRSQVQTNPGTVGSFPKKIQRPSQTLKQPGKLNLKSFAIVNEALARMNLGDSNNSNFKDFSRNKKMLTKPSTKLKQSHARLLEHAPLAAPEDDSGEDYEEAEYEQIQNDGFSEAVNNIASQLFSYSAQDQGSIRSKLRQRREKEQHSKNLFLFMFTFESFCFTLFFGKLNETFLIQ